MSLSFTAEVRDRLSNLAASLNAGKDKTQGDAFFLFDLDRSQVEAMYRGDWLARKIIDIVPYDMVREWRAWSGDRADVAAAEAAERRFNLRKLVQRALTLGRLYGGAALIIGTGEEDPADLARELVPEWVRPGGIKFLHVVSRWQLSTPTVNRDPLSPWFGEPDLYEITAPTRGSLWLHPSRLIRFLGNELPDPSIGVSESRASPTRAPRPPHPAPKHPRLHCKHPRHVCRHPSNRSPRRRSSSNPRAFQIIGSRDPRTAKVVSNGQTRITQIRMSVQCPEIPIVSILISKLRI